MIPEEAWQIVSMSGVCHAGEGVERDWLTSFLVALPLFIQLLAKGLTMSQTVELQKLVVRLMGDPSSYMKMLSQAQTAATKASAHISRSFSATTAAFASVAMGAAKIGTAAATAGAAGALWGVKLAASAEQTQVAFKVMLGSAREAQRMMKDLSGFAAATPFELPEIERSARMLLAFGYQGNEVTKTLEMFGNVAAGVGAPLDEIAELMGKNKVQGRLFMVDLNQLSGRGIPIISELAKQFGVAESAIREMVEDGQIQYKHLERAFESLGGAGGRFAGLMEEQSKTVAGRWSTLKDTIAINARRMGESIIKAIDLSTLIANTTKALEFFSQEWKTVGNYVIQYGHYMVVSLWNNFKFFFTDQLWPLVKAMPTLFYEAFKTILANAYNFSVALWNAIKGEGWEFQFEGLSEAFYNELSKIPSAADRPMTQLENNILKDLDYLGTQLNTSWGKAFAAPEVEAIAADVKPVTDALDEIRKKSVIKLTVDPMAVRAGTEQFEKMLAGFQMSSSMAVNVKGDEKQVRVLGEIRDILKKESREPRLELVPAGF